MNLHKTTGKIAAAAMAMHLAVMLVVTHVAQQTTVDIITQAATPTVVTAVTLLAIAAQDVAVYPNGVYGLKVV